MSLLDKLMKNSTSKYTATLTDSKIYGEKDMVPTRVPMVNVALSSKVDGGLTPGLTILAGPSKHFKSAFALLMAGAFQAKYPEGVVLFYDSEFGTPEKYFETFRVDPARVIHTPIQDVEELKFDIMQQLTNLDRDDQVMIVIDSIGNLASKKEVEDAMDQKSVADMSRAKALKSLFRIVTPRLTLLDIPMVAINHTYKEIGMFPKDVVGGGCVVAGTKILTNEGIVEIQDIEPGDVVITQYGDQTVKAVWSPDTLFEGKPECYDITFEDGLTVTCSADHEFLINGQWIAAKDLAVGDDCQTL